MSLAEAAALAQMTVAELKAMCRDQGKPVGGNKAVLKQRLLHEAAVPSKARGTAAPSLNLSNTLPDTAGPWLQKSVQTWGLVGPFNTQLSDDHWQQYYQERKALDHRLMAESQEEDDKENAAAPVTWQESFPLPTMQPICRESYADQNGGTAAGELRQFQKHISDKLFACVRGCKGLANAAQLQEAMKGSFYFLDYWVNWEDEDLPRTVEATGRLYAPTGTGYAVDVSYSYHMRARMYEVEEFSNVKAGVRTTMLPAKPTSMAPRAQIYDMEYDNRRKANKRTITTKQHLEDICQALFGRSKAVSSRKIFSIALYSGGVSAFSDSCDWLFRVSRRKFSLNGGEESDARSSGDRDSGNEKKMKKPLAKKRKFGGGFGGFRGGFGNPYYNLFGF